MQASAALADTTIDIPKGGIVFESDIQNLKTSLFKVQTGFGEDFTKEKFNADFNDVLLKEIENTGYLDASWPTAWTMVMTSHIINA